jgi:glycosyltransferase involved in cell wall biosynthesis
VLNEPGEVWHAGLSLGMAGRPGLIDFVAPTWMLNRDPAPESVATSWRLSFRACLLKTDVLRQMGLPDPGFQTLAGAALEMGHRLITCGVFMRHIPWLVDSALPPEPLPFEDELRFVKQRFGAFWSRWALCRAVLTGYVSPQKAIRAWSLVRGKQGSPAPYHRSAATSPMTGKAASVTVLIPTIDRYPYLRTLLTQLRAQTVKPDEIIIVDQTELDRRDTTLAGDFADLPLRIIYLDKAGQCSSRNAGLKASTGSYILFIDDDDEVQPDLIARHLENMQTSGCDVSCGAIEEVGSGLPPYHFTYQRVSDVFPAGNALVRREVLKRSGLFDLAYDRMSRADGDLGMRIYLSGAFMVYNPGISVLHHHAPRGGLRTHKARVITYASSRSHLLHRHLPSISESYLEMRYFSIRQQREAQWMRVFGTFAAHGKMYRKLLKVMIGLVLLPDTLLRIRKAYRQAMLMLDKFPQISKLDS